MAKKIANPDHEEPGRSLRFMGTPSEWPNHPYLTVKRPKQGEPLGELGIMIEHPVRARAATVVYLACLYMMPSPLSQAEKISYPDLEAVIADGWVVD